MSDYKEKFEKMKMSDLKTINLSFIFTNQTSSPIAQNYSRELRRSTSHYGFDAMIHRPAPLDDVMCTHDCSHGSPRDLKSKSTHKK